MPNQSISLNSYDPEVGRIRRQQQLAEMLQQQAMEPLQPVSPNAPISPLSVLGKVLQAYGAKRNLERSDTEYADLQAKRQSELAQMLSQQYQVPESNGVITNQPNTQTDVSGIQAPTISLVSEARPTTMEEQLLNALRMQRSTNPQAQQMGIDLAQGVQQRMTGREDELWKRGLPMSKAAQQQQAAQNQGAIDVARAKNELGPSPQEIIQNRLEAQKLADLRAYRASQTGAGLTEDGAPNPAVEAHYQAVKSGNEMMQNVPMALRTQVAMRLNKTPGTEFSPRAKTQMTLSSERITAPYKKMPQYELTAGGQVYLDRINAALKTKGSVSDQDLLDSLTKLNTGGNAVTDAQVKLVTDGKSFADSLAVWGGKLKNGGVLSDNQREQIRSISNDIAENYRKSYQPVYDAASKQLEAAQIPKQFWTIPDLNKLHIEANNSSNDKNAEAMAWLKANPNDPRAPAIRAKLGIK